MKQQLIKKNKLFFPVAALLASALLAGCLQRFDNYGVVGTMVSNADHTSVTVVVAENNAVTYQQNGGFRKTTYNTTYWLKQYETASGNLIKKKKLFSPSDENRLSIACYGRYGNNIWLYINGLTAFDINTLEEVTNEKKIAAANSVPKTIFPVGDRLIRPGLAKGDISFTADNGEEYRITLNNLAIIKKEEEEQNAEVEEKQINRLFHDDDYGVRCDTFNKQMFAFAKNESAAKECSPGSSDISETAYRMKLFKAGYTIHQLGVHNSFTYENIQQAVAETYLNPCFAADTYNNNIIHLSNPDGYIVIHQDVLGEKSKAMITRLDVTGKVIWEKPAGVSTKIEGCTLQGKYLLLSTNKDYMLSPFIGKDALCIIDTENGNIVRPMLAD